MTNVEVTKCQKLIGSREIEIKKRRLREQKILGNLIGATIWDGKESLCAVNKLQQKLHVFGVIYAVDDTLKIIDGDISRHAKHGDLIGVTKSKHFVVITF